jgi:hypothetical protein
MPAGGSALSALGSLAGGAAELPVGSDIPLSTYATLLTSDRVLLATGNDVDIKGLYQLANDDLMLGRLRNMVSATVDPNRTVVIAVKVYGTPSVVRPSDLVNRAAANARDEPYRQLTTKLIDRLIVNLGQVADLIKLDRNKARVQSLQTRLGRVKGELADAEQQLMDLQTRLGKIDPTTYAQGATSALLQARSELGAVTAQLREAEQNREAVRRNVARQAAEVERLPGETDFLSEHRRQLQQAKVELADARRKYGPQSAEVLNGEAAMTAAQRALDRAVKSAHEGLTPPELELDTTIAGLKAKQATLQKLASRAEEEIRNLPQQLQALLNQQVDVQMKRDTVKQLEGQLLVAQMEYERSGMQWFVLDSARAPLYKSSPSTSRAVVSGAMLGGLLFGWPLLGLFYRRLLEA